MKSNHDKAQPTIDRTDTIALIGLLTSAALALMWLTSSATADHDQRKAALAKEVVARHCVVADVDMRVPSLYKCDLPTPNTYVRAADLNAEALTKYARK